MLLRVRRSSSPSCFRPPWHTAHRSRRVGITSCCVTSGFAATVPSLTSVAQIEAHPPILKMIANNNLTTKMPAVTCPFRSQKDCFLVSLKGSGTFDPLNQFWRSLQGRSREAPNPVSPETPLSLPLSVFQEMDSEQQSTLSTSGLLAGSSRHTDVRAGDISNLSRVHLAEHHGFNSALPARDVTADQEFPFKIEPGIRWRRGVGLEVLWSGIRNRPRRVR